jgi:FADH2 O2-dependent halogenase
VLERETFPRPHVGESLVPSSTRILDELGLLGEMEASRFPRKYGAAWTSGSAAPTYQVDWQDLLESDRGEVRFDERAQPGVRQPYTYHVDRARFDELLLRRAEALGASVRQGTAVRWVDLDDPDGVRLRCAIAGREHDLTARVVIDASGRRTLLGTQLGWRVRDAVFDQYAVHGWFAGFDRMAWAKSAQTRDYIFIHFLPVSNSWVWQIPIDEDVTSVGVVTQRRDLRGRRQDRERLFWDRAASRPDLFEALRASRQLAPLKEEGDYSYAMTQLATDRAVLIGDAARFVDPIFSTGVSIALTSARLAALDVLEALGSGDTSRETFRRYEETIGRGLRTWYEFIALYYRLNVLFTWFVRQPRYRPGLLKLLQGDVYDEDEPWVLGEMRTAVEEVERDRDHPWHQLLGDLTAETFVRLARERAAR